MSDCSLISSTWTSVDFLVNYSSGYKPEGAGRRGMGYRRRAARLRNNAGHDYVTVCGFPLIPGSGRYVG